MTKITVKDLFDKKSKKKLTEVLHQYLKFIKML